MRRSLSLFCLMLAASASLSCRSSVLSANAAAARQQTSPSSLKEMLQEMKQAGLPITPHELQAPLPPDAQNAAPLYLQLDTLLTAKPTVGDDKAATDTSFDRPLTAEQARKLRKTFQHRADIGKLIHQAVARPDCVFVRPWEDGLNIRFPEFAKIRMAARWLAAESALQLYDGKTMESIRTEALGFRLATHVAKDPMLVAFLVANAIDAITLRGMNRILYAAGEQPGIALAVQQAIEAGAQPRSLAHGLRDEMLFPLVVMDNMRRNGFASYDKSIEELTPNVHQPSTQISDDDRQHWNQFMDRSEITMLRMLQNVIEAADKPYPEAQAAFHSEDVAIEAHSQDPTYVTLDIIFPVFSQAPSKRAMVAARAAAARAGAAILIWKAKHKALPATLVMAMPQVPLDPFDGEPIRYKKSGNSFVVYSVGPTGHFDGGVSTIMPKASESLFRYPIPAYLK